MSQVASGASAPVAKAKASLGRSMALGCGGFIVAIGLFAVGVFALATIALRSSDAYGLALNAATHDPIVIAELGAPLRAGWLSTGQVNLSGSGGDATLTIPISGPRASGTLNVRANKSAGKWSLTQLDVDISGRTAPLDLLAATP
jgi:hypothetical protein